MTLEEQIIDSLTLEDLDGHSDLKFIAETCGLELAKVIRRELGGMAFSIPSVRSQYFRPALKRYLLNNCKNLSTKTISQNLRIHSRTVDNIMREIRKEQADENQLSLY